MKNINFKTLCLRLNDETLLLTDVIFSGDEPDPNDECFLLGYPTVMDYCENGSLKLRPYHTDILFHDDIKEYVTASDEALEQYNRFIIKKVDYFTLTSGEDSQRKYPDTFHIPDRVERENIAVGTNVKLIFKENLIEDYDETITERMWVTIIESDNTSYVGTINNIPFEETFMQYGDVIKFSAEHVIDIEPQYLSSLAA